MSILLHGDCLEELKSIDDNSVDLIFCDLPYGQLSIKWDCCIDLNKLWIEIMRIKKLKTPIFFTTTTKFGVELINTAPKKCPFRYDMVWEKNIPVGFLNAKHCPLRSHEMLYVFFEKRPLYDISSHIPKRVRINKKPLPDNYIPPSEKDLYRQTPETYHNRKTLSYTPRLPTSILKIDCKRGNHSTEKPIELMEWILKYHSLEGDVILDPTMGSGSMGVACKNMNRKFIGIEMNDDYYETAVKRIEE